MTTETRPESLPVITGLDPYDVERIRRDFPVLRERIRGKNLAYLDNAATTQKPLTVIYALQRYYTSENANIHRGVHFLSQQSTFAYERSRARIRQFVNARDNCEIIFVRGTTEAINLVAQSFGRMAIGAGDEIILSHLEHHSNIVPWQMLCAQTGARIRVVPVDDDGAFLYDEYERLLSERTKLVSVTHASNALGTVLPIKRITERAHQWGARVLVDGAQAVSHLPVDVQDLDCDFYAFSGHKMFGPTGVGVLYGRQAVLEEMPPYQGGGEMINTVTFDKTTYAELPNKFEAGTPNIAGGIAMEAAVDYINSVGRSRIAAYENELLAYGTQVLSQVEGLRLIGTARQKVAVLSFTLDAAHPHDIGTILDAEGIAVRTGHHCAQPVMQRFGVPATARASLAVYNTREELDALAVALAKVIEVFS
jgi:cysteine desulfurase / selenocysteine lyase